MQPAIILDLQKEYLTEVTSAPKLFRDLGKMEHFLFFSVECSWRRTSLTRQAVDYAGKWIC
jgi:hypothetical protein